MEERPQEFKNKRRVYLFIENEAVYRIKKSQFYDHCKEGKLQPDLPDGRYSLGAVTDYCRSYLRLDGSGITEETSQLQREKLETELAREKVRLAKDTHSLGVMEGKYVPREDFELAIVARAVAFMAHLNHMIQSNAPDWIDTVDGDQTRAAELIHQISADVEQRMSDFAADTEFEIILEPS